MKILYVIETLGKGGAERLLVDLLPALNEKGINCEVAILFEKYDLVEELEKKGIKVYKLQLSYKWNIFEALKKLKKTIEQNNYDIIHSHLFFANFYISLYKLFFFKKMKTVVSLHSMTYKAYPSTTLWKKFRKKIDCFLLNTFDKKVAVSKAVKEHYKKECNLNDIIVSYNFINDKKIKNCMYKNFIFEANLIEKINKSTYVFLTPGRFVKEKGHDILVDAIKKLNKEFKDTLFIFIGDGPTKDKLFKKAPQNIVFLEAMEYCKLINFYNYIDAVIVPSRHEAFGLVVCEAMFLQKPLITTNIDGIKEIVSDDEAFIVKNLTSNDLYNTIKKYIESEKEIKVRKVKLAYDNVQKFLLSRNIYKWINLYKEIINEK